MYFGDNSGNAGGRRAGFIQYAHGSDTMKIGANEVDVLELTDDKVMVWKDIKAHANASRDIGASGSRFDNIFCVNLNESSDRRLKNTIQTSDLGLSFINKLNPVSYKFIRTEEQKKDNRTHYGLIAQEVEEVIKEEGKTLDDFAAVAEIEGEYGINYSEMISPLIKAIQELSAEVSTLKTKIAVLESS